MGATAEQIFKADGEVVASIYLTLLPRFFLLLHIKPYSFGVLNVNSDEVRTPAVLS